MILSVLNMKENKDTARLRMNILAAAEMLTPYSTPLGDNNSLGHGQEQQELNAIEGLVCSDSLLNFPGTPEKQVLALFSSMISSK